ncbi:MAG: hypothetical protein Q9217_003882 [Psora testacea]
MMINRKDTPAPFTRRVEPATSSRTMVTTTTTTAYSPNALPQTPQNKPRMKRASKLQRGRERYLETNTRVSADEIMRDGRISHDLNLTDNPRHSVVDNMLMSLNPDQPTPFTPPKDRPPFSSGSEASVPPNAAHSRPLYSSSTDSDHTFPSGDSPHRHSYGFSPGRCSNSTSTFPSAPRRIDSVYTQREGAQRKKPNIFSPQRAIDVDAKPREHARKGSRGSGSSSIDLGQTTRHAMAMPSSAPRRRSASFNHAYARRGLHSASSSVTHPTTGSSLSQPVAYNDIDAAPMPTVPAGPRRGDYSPVFPPHPMHSPSGAPVIQRRNSNKSSGSLHAGKGKGDPLQQEESTPASNGFLSSKRSSKQVLPTNGYTRSRITSPTRHVSDQLTLPMKGSPKDMTKERPGFFRRVFGSSRGPAPADSFPSNEPNQQSSERVQTNHQNYQAFTNRLYNPSAMEDLTKAQLENVPPLLVKKPSSFFRRRKKSVSDNVSSSVFPPHLQANFGDIKQHPAPHSPTSSLRKVMNPYLDCSKTSPEDAQSAQIPSTTQITSVPSHADTIRRRPFTEPAPPDSTSKVEAGGGNYRYQHVSIPPTDTHNAKSFVNPNVISRKPADISFLNDDSSESRTSEPKDNVNPSNEVRSRAPAKFAVNFPPRSTSKNVVGKLGERHKENSGGPGVLSPQNADMASSRRIKISAAKRFENQTGRTDTQSISTRGQPSPAGSKASSERLWLQPSKLDEDHRKTEEEAAQRIDGTETSPGSEVFYSATSYVHPLKTDDVRFPEPTAERKVSIDVDLSVPTNEDRSQAKLLYDGDETVTLKSMAAAWLGEPGPERARVRQSYMGLFRWQNLNILASLRDLCGRLYLKAESQQVDRILDAFSARWCCCNPLHGFKASDVVHTICYSILLLNTDLHQAEIETKMTRTQFLRNIMPTIGRVVTDAAPDAFTNPRASTTPPARARDQRPETILKSRTFHGSSEEKRSFEGQRPLCRLRQMPSDQTVYSSNMPLSSLDYNTGGDCGPLVNAPFHGKQSSWETQIEIVLKDFYNSIRQQPLPLFGKESKQSILEAPASANSLSAAAGNFLRRTPSMLSKTGSESKSYSRGRASDNRLGTGRWQSKTRSRPRLYPASTVASSRRSSFDEHSSITSPSVASAWSRFSSIGKTQTTLSTDSFASSYPQAEYQQSIGFANALSQAIIREEGAGGDEESLRAAPLLEDESLELHGAPWAKEGILKHKHHLESVDKKAKERNWVESFCVIERGYMRLFSFSMNAKSLRQKAKSQKATGGVVGGGNWADNAELLGSFVLRQTLASGLPEPGYSKARPHVWALSLPTGAIHLFQVGTPEIVKEFVATANYWSARLSKEPLMGGVSNIEYGWSHSVINAALVHPAENTTSSASATGTRPSLQSSIRSARSSIDQGSFRPKLPGDKILINDWTPPPQSMAASALMEVDQLKALSNYVKNIEMELQTHNELRGAVLLAFSPRHPNSSRAMTNWERKSSYLLHELVKFKTYIDSLREAQARKAIIYADREGKAAEALNTEGALESGSVQKVVEA